MGFPLPLIGDIPTIVRYFNKENKLPLVKFQESIGGTKFSMSCVGFRAHLPLVVISNVKTVEQLYTTHNSLFDKHPLTKNLTL